MLRLLIMLIVTSTIVLILLKIINCYNNSRKKAFLDNALNSDKNMHYEIKQATKENYVYRSYKNAKVLRNDYSKYSDIEFSLSMESVGGPYALQYEGVLLLVNNNNCLLKRYSLYSVNTTLMTSDDCKNSIQLLTALVDNNVFNKTLYLEGVKETDVGSYMYLQIYNRGNSKITKVEIEGIRNINDLLLCCNNNYKCDKYRRSYLDLFFSDIYRKDWMVHNDLCNKTANNEICNIGSRNSLYASLNLDKNCELKRNLRTLLLLDNKYIHNYRLIDEIENYRDNYKERNHRNTGTQGPLKKPTEYNF